MKILLQIYCLCFLLSSCENTALLEQNDTALSPEDSLLLFEKQIDDTRLNILPSEQISNSDVYIYPIGSALKKNSRGSYYSKKVDAYRIWNLIFYNLKTNEKRILFADKVPIKNKDAGIIKWRPVGVLFFIFAQFSNRVFFAQ